MTGAEAAADANTFVHSGSGTEKLLGEIIENFAFSREKAGFVSYAQSFKVFYYKLFVVAVMLSSSSLSGESPRSI